MLTTSKLKIPNDGQKRIQHTIIQHKLR